MKTSIRDLNYTPLVKAFEAAVYNAVWYKAYCQVDLTLAHSIGNAVGTVLIRDVRLSIYHFIQDYENFY